MNKRKKEIIIRGLSLDDLVDTQISKLSVHTLIEHLYDDRIQTELFSRLSDVNGIINVVTCLYRDNIHTSKFFRAKLNDFLKNYSTADLIEIVKSISIYSSWDYKYDELRYYGVYNKSTLANVIVRLLFNKIIDKDDSTLIPQHVLKFMAKFKLSAADKLLLIKYTIDHKIKGKFYLDLLDSMTKQTYKKTYKYIIDNGSNYHKAMLLGLNNSKLCLSTEEINKCTKSFVSISLESLYDVNKLKVKLNADFFATLSSAQKYKLLSSLYLRGIKTSGYPFNKVISNTEISRALFSFAFSEHDSVESILDINKRLSKSSDDIFDYDDDDY